jgi:hypothetical protein
VLPVYIRRNIKLAEAPSYGKTIFEYESNCHGAEDYRKVAEFIHTQMQPNATEGPETKEKCPIKIVEPAQPSTQTSTKVAQTTAVNSDTNSDETKNVK